MVVGGLALRHRRAEQLADQLPGQRREADPGRHAQVVLQHAELAGAVADHVEPREARPHRLVEALHVGLVERAVLDQPQRDLARVDDLALAVGVAQEGVERAHALLEPARQPVPLLAREQPRHGVDHEVAGPGRAVADAALAHLAAQLLGQLGEVGGAERVEHRPVVGARLPVVAVGLVVVVPHSASLPGLSAPAASRRRPG